MKFEIDLASFLNKAILAALGMAFLTGCATSANYEKILGTWVGSSEQQLIQSWGPPDNVFESGGQKYLTYVKGGSAYIPGTSPTYQTQITHIPCRCPSTHGG